MIRLSNKHPAGLNLSSILILLFIAILPTTAIAADTADAPTLKDLVDEEPKEGEEAKQNTVTKVIPQDEFDRGTPRSSIMGFAEAMENRDYDRAMNYLDTRNVPSHLLSEDQELARELKIIAERSLWVDMDSISNDPEGHKDDGLPGNRDIIARLETPDGAVDILMQHVPDGKGEHVWKISNRTVSKIPLLYEHYGYGEYGDKLSRILPDYEFLGMVVWQWVMLLGIVLYAFAISWLITRIASLILSLRKDHPYTRLHTFIARPVRFLVFAVIVRLNHDLISPTYTTNAILEAKTLEVIALTWVITGMVGLAFGRLGDRMKDSGNDQAVVMLRPAATLVKVIIILIATISWLGNLGFNVSAMLAGLGVGGSLLVSLHKSRSRT